MGAGVYRSEDEGSSGLVPKVSKTALLSTDQQYEQRVRTPSA